MLYKTPPFSSSKIFVTGVFWRLRNHTFDGHISGSDQDRDNMKPLLPTKSPIPYRLVPLASRSRDHTTSGLAFLAFPSHSPVVGHGHVGEKWGLCQRLIPGAGGQYESENISGCVARRFTKVSGFVAGDEPGPWPEDFPYLTKGI